ncbi:facilitated trehalose transporter Tret1-like [Diabrotica virgifera virgifera]|uniref:Facilitated trehalose transporter Tret1-like n=1 Tax=Diabrotica virgifera virgifera TaxID=50390 RepID=A0A6P7GY61_DIAVI|nr:facilitated trehalose transporter Tret1-like [Diabrotica virgifera virgifera]
MEQRSEVVYKSVCENVEGKLLLKKEDGPQRKNRTFLYLSAVIANLFIFGVSSLFSWTSSAIEKLTSNSSDINPLGEPITAVQESWIASLLQLGAAIGPLLFGKLSDIIGRKKTLLIMAVTNVICLSILCYARNITIFYICRFINGLVIGMAFAITPVYLSEISEVHNRGAISTLQGIFMNGGVLFSFLLGPLCSLKLLTFLCALPLILFIILFGIFIPETPVFLVSVHKEDEAKEALKKLRMAKDVNDEFKSILASFEALNKKEQGALEVFKDAGSRKALIITIGLMFTSQCSAVNSVVSYLDTIFKASGSTLPLYFLTNAVGVIQVVGNCISVALIEKLGRKILILTSVVGILLTEITLAVYFYLKDVQQYNMEGMSWLPVTSTIAFIFFISLGLSPLPFTIMGEIFSHSTKAFGSALGCCSGFLFSFVVTFLFRVFMNLYGLAFCFSLTSCFVFCGMVFIYFMLPETKGKSESEIQRMLIK